ncbi:Hypothetical protein R9X50_00099100 [Acrodontium crateriforme]|uniref:C3H1-type domain-containing protein n=1 Tax=Acrodontium crateriforme TaxID=150365 RepID=A0AAQ3LZW8_9PEZI|nr:Hypothetical protein R9X50_00099100 [Acrodontium crateriforme]
MPPGICFDFQRGRCRRGNCRFSHDTSTSTARSRSNTNQESREETETEASCRKWTHMIPRPSTISPRFGAAVDTQTFFQMGWNVIKSEDAGTRQDVITKLSAETGLAIIKTLTDSMDANQDDESTVSIFRNKALPFYRIISHPDVLSSLILENPVHTIYTFLFGPGGRRGLQVFRSTATALSRMISGHSSSNEEVSIVPISSSLAVLDRLIEINQSAQVIEGFTAIVETIFACIPENFMIPNVQQCLTRIRRRLNIGASLPLAPTLSTTQNLPSATFELCQDLPGNLSGNGARHDNDHASIADIQILPTAQEIVSPRQEYLPLVNSTQNHLSGLAGLLDRQFRLLREDTVGQLRDAVREEFARLESPNRKGPTIHQGQQGVRKLIYHNVHFSRLSVDRKKGLQVVAEFDQPPQINNKSMKQREDWWKGSKLLQVDSLVCFVSSNYKIIFLCVCDPMPFHGKQDSNSDNARRSDDVPSLFRQAKRASVLLGLAEYKTEDVIWMSAHTAPSKTRQSLVEFPGVLLPSFQPTLQALQGMSRKLSLPFAEIIAPDSKSSAAVVRPPAYATKTGFSFNLDVLAGVPLILKPGEAFDFTKLDGGSTLDEAQQFAVIQALSTGLALIQGPPGTGKSYTGVAIVKALLHNRKAANLGPIICVCYTNHALDQLLEHLVKDGVRQIIRIGSRSKSDLLQNLTLHHVREGAKPTKTEKHDTWQHNRDIEETLRNIEEILLGLKDRTSWRNIQAHLTSTHNRHYQELFGKRTDKYGFQEVRGRKFRVVESWLRGAPKKLNLNRPVAELSAISLSEMSTSERGALHKHWIQQRSAQLTNDLIDELDSYHCSKSALDRCYRELDLRCLRQAHVIGVTTSGLARNIELLNRVGAKVMLCEEAGEVLEAHILTALLPGVEHAILIGDHEQLRPQINNYELQHDHPRGKGYSLDISLFERLVRPQMGNPQVPLSTLKTQRRMHPCISELVRVPLYPDLQDHPAVLEYPEVDGIRDRLYWLDHREKEDPRPANAVSLSRTNSFEVDMIAALVSHLVRQGTYGSEDIAVITPYLGQLQKIRKRLANSFEIVVGDRDQEELEARGLQGDPESSTNGQVQFQKTTLLNALRIATVDNFQGEEAKICAHPTIKGMVVDLILSSTFEEIDLNENPCIMPSCGHMLTLETMDGHMSMSDFYTTNGEGSIVELKNSAEPFSASGMKSCPTCRGPLRSINRYSRIVRRALIDEATKKFIVWANMEFIPLVTKMQAIEAELRDTAGGSQTASNKLSPETPLSRALQLKGGRDDQISQIEALTRKENRYKTIINLRREIKKFLQQVDEKEQPFGRIYDLVQDTRRHRGVNIVLHSKVDILQVRNRLLTTVLLIRCDYTILLTFFNDRKRETSASSFRIQVDMSINREECEKLMAESQSRKQPGNYVEGILYWARFLALERSLAEPGSELTELLDKARRQLQLAHETCDEYPGQTAGMRNEVEEVEKMLRDSTFYMPVSNEEKAAVYAAMARDFRGTGHWSQNVNMADVAPNRTNGTAATQVGKGGGPIQSNSLATPESTPTPEAERIAVDQLRQSIEVSELEKFLGGGFDRRLDQVEEIKIYLARTPMAVKNGGDWSGK